MPEARIPLLFSGLHAPVSRALSSGFRLPALALLIVVAAGLDALASPDEVTSTSEAVLAQQVPGFDAARAHDAALAAMLTSSDPGARWFTEAEAQEWRTQTATSGVPEAVMINVQEWPEGVRYIRVAQISGASRPTLAEVLAISNSSAGIILDLRGAGGTGITSVVEASGLCVTSGAALFSIVEGGGITRMITAPANASALTRPLAVLVDGHSSGAAELLAGVLRSRPGVMLIGYPTAGEMCQRELLDLGNGRWALAAVVRWLPWGSRHQLAGGVTPDVLLTERPAAAMQGASLGPNPGDKRWSRRTAAEHELVKLVGNDSALQRAVDLLLAARAVGAYAQR